MKIAVIAVMLALGATAQGQFIYKAGKSTAKMDTLKANGSVVVVKDGTGTWNLVQSSGGGTYTASNGITLAGSDFQLGGNLSTSNILTQSNNTVFQIADAFGSLKLLDGTQRVYIYSNDPDFIHLSGTEFYPDSLDFISGNLHTEYTSKGFNYTKNIASINASNPRWLPDKQYVDSVSGGGSTQLEDTLYISSSNLLAGINDTLVNTSASTTKTQNIYTTCLISYRHVSTAYTGGTTDTIAVFGKYKGVKKKLLYISSSYITDAYSGRGQFPIAWDKLDPGSPIWVHIPAFSTGNGILRMRFIKKQETW